MLNELRHFVNRHSGKRPTYALFVSEYSVPSGGDFQEGKSSALKFQISGLTRDLRNVRKNIASNPDESNANAPGSGTATVVKGPDTTGVTVPPLLVSVVVVVQEFVEMVLPCIVTAAFKAMTLPHPSVAPVSKLTAVSAIISPANDVVVPRVAELPTCQYTLSPATAFSITTLEALAVVGVLGIRKTKFPAAPPKLRVRVPVN